MRCQVPGCAFATSTMLKLGLVALNLCIAFPVVSSARTVYVTPLGEPGYTERGELVPSPGKFETGTFKNLSPGDVVVLLATSKDQDAVTIYDRARIEILDVTAPFDPVVIRGLGARTRIRGRPVDAFRCAMPRDPDMRGCAEEASADVPSAATLASLGRDRRSGPLGRFLESAPTTLFSDPGDAAMATTSTTGRFGEASCFDLVRVDGMIFENLHFEDCWLSAIRTRTSRNITLRDSFIVGGTWGLSVGGDRKPATGAARVEKITVERVTWIQDASGYADPFKLSCKPEYSWNGNCPGRMWRELPWGVVHHGAYRYFNGSLLAGKHVAGDIVFRHNRVLNAYNGIRLTASVCTGPVDKPRTECPFNNAIWIYDNLFSYVRDNPVEFEHWATRAFVFNNRFHDSHAWLSFDGMGGGPVYVYGNVGWFDDRPGNWGRFRGCERTPTVDRGPFGQFDPTLDRVFDEQAGWLKVGEIEFDNGKGIMGVAREMRCEQSIVGRPLKFSLPEAGSEGDPPKFGEYNFPRTGPIYVFNNSWYLRAPLTAGGAPANVRHWNNAILFCERGTPGFDAELCRPDPWPTREDCGSFVRADPGLDRYLAAGATPFFDCFRWRPFDERGDEVTDFENMFDWDVSANGFPHGLPPDFESRGRRAAPGFRRPDQGDFRLVEGAAAATSGCRVVDLGDGRLACTTGTADGGFAGAFDRTGTLYKGPGSGLFTPPR
jgi:hypothetical protein